MRLPYLNGKKPGHNKIYEAVDMTIEGSWQVHVSYDFNNPEAEETVGTFAQSTWNGGRAELTGYGSHISLRFHNNDDQQGGAVERRGALPGGGRRAMITIADRHHGRSRLRGVVAVGIDRKELVDHPRSQTTTTPSPRTPTPIRTIYKVALDDVGMLPVFAFGARRINRRTVGVWGFKTRDGQQGNSHRHQISVTAMSSRICATPGSRERSATSTRTITASQRWLAHMGFRPYGHPWGDWHPADPLSARRAR